MSVLERAKMLARQRYLPKSMGPYSPHIPKDIRTKMNAFIVGYCEAREEQKAAFIEGIHKTATSLGVEEYSEVREVINSFKKI